MGLKPLKRFGQNYLIDKNIANKMIQSINLSSQDSVVEIGPGKGFITTELFKTLNKLVGVEIDNRVIEKLKSDFPNLSLITTDFLKLNLEELEATFLLKVIGNIPFNQTGNILFKLLDNKNLIAEAALIIPYDIAKRIVAVKNTKAYGSLTVIFNYFTFPKLVQKVSPAVFLPKPNIDAAIIHLDFNKKENETIDKDLFIKVVKASFGNRRKTIKNSLSNSIFAGYDFTGLDFPFGKRAEDLEITDFLYLTRFIQN